jgi:hypothetical protein
MDFATSPRRTGTLVSPRDTAFAKHQTARNVLLFFSELNTIYLQNAAAMTVLHLGRSGSLPGTPPLPSSNSPRPYQQKMFRSIEVFVTDEWAVLCEQMKHTGIVATV